MSVATTRRRLVAIWQRITGVRTAYDNIPRKLQAAQLPGVVIFPADALYDTDIQGDDTNVETRQYRMVLYLCEVAFEGEGDLQIDADPFFETVKNHFLARPQLTLDNATEPQDVVYNARLVGDAGFQIGTYPLTADKQYALIEWRLEVKEVGNVSYVN